MNDTPESPQFAAPGTRLSGDKDTALVNLGAARSLLQLTKLYAATTGTDTFGLTRSLPDGSEITATLFGGREYVTSFGAPKPSTPISQRSAEHFAEPARPEPEHFAEPARPEPERFAEPARPEPERFAEPARPEPEHFAEPTRPEPEHFVEPARPEPEHSAEPARPESERAVEPDRDEPAHVVEPDRDEPAHVVEPDRTENFAEPDITEPDYIADILYEPEYTAELLDELEYIEEPPIDEPFIEPDPENPAPPPEEKAPELTMEKWEEDWTFHREKVTLELPEREIVWVHIVAKQLRQPNETTVTSVRSFSERMFCALYRIPRFRLFADPSTIEAYTAGDTEFIKTPEYQTVPIGYSMWYTYSECMYLLAYLSGPVAYHWLDCWIYSSLESHSQPSRVMGVIPYWYGYGYSGVWNPAAPLAVVVYGDEAAWRTQNHATGSDAPLVPAWADLDEYGVRTVMGDLGEWGHTRGQPFTTATMNLDPYDSATYGTTTTMGQVATAVDIDNDPIYFMRYTHTVTTYPWDAAELEQFTQMQYRAPNWYAVTRQSVHADVRMKNAVFDIPYVYVTAGTAIYTHPVLNYVQVVRAVGITGTVTLGGINLATGEVVSVETIEAAVLEASIPHRVDRLIPTSLDTAHISDALVLTAHKQLIDLTLLPEVAGSGIFAEVMGELTASAITAATTAQKKGKWYASSGDVSLEINITHTYVHERMLPILDQTLPERTEYYEPPKPSEM